MATISRGGQTWHGQASPHVAVFSSWPLSHCSMCPTCTIGHGGMILYSHSVQLLFFPTPTCLLPPHLPVYLPVALPWAGRRRERRRMALAWRGDIVSSVAAHITAPTTHSRQRSARAARKTIIGSPHAHISATCPPSASGVFDKPLKATI